MYCTHGPAHTKVDRDATVIGIVVMQNLVKEYEKWRSLKTSVTLACEGHNELVYCTH